MHVSYIYICCGFPHMGDSSVRVLPIALRLKPRSFGVRVPLERRRTWRYGVIDFIYHDTCTAHA